MRVVDDPMPRDRAAHAGQALTPLDDDAMLESVAEPLQGGTRRTAVPGDPA